ncbi:MAG TPA: sugar phosphate isomerase/epimerase family protein [Vicinamibacterales bacterium]|nr:sugar phosphate isomerase/epimerase family protein [Vicinamibacterales bacterium]
MTKIRPVIVVATFALYVPSDTSIPKPDLQSPPSASAVKVGYCTGLKNLEAAKAAGFDYVEVSATEIAALTDDEFAAATARIKALGIPTPAANLFLPATLKVTGPDVHPDEQMAHVHKALTRLATLGTEIVVFGSGGARRVPDGFSQSDALSQLVDFGRRAAREARANGITITIEPLRKQETNIINTAAEGLDLVNAIGDPNFQLMIDFYHLAIEHEDPAIVFKAKDHIRHLHMANPQGRVFPQAWDEFDYAPFFANLRAIGYNKRISVEASTTDLAQQGPRAITLLRRAFEPVR